MLSVKEFASAVSAKAICNRALKPCGYESYERQLIRGGNGFKLFASNGSRRLGPSSATTPMVDDQLPSFWRCQKYGVALHCTVE
jgi:hypothetical protein